MNFLVNNHKSSAGASALPYFQLTNFLSRRSRMVDQNLYFFQIIGKICRQSKLFGSKCIELGPKKNHNFFVGNASSSGNRRIAAHWGDQSKHLQQFILSDPSHFDAIAQCVLLALQSYHLKLRLRAQKKQRRIKIYVGIYTKIRINKKFRIPIYRKPQDGCWCCRLSASMDIHITYICYFNFINRLAIMYYVVQLLFVRG